VTVTSIRLGLWVLPFRVVHDRVSRMSARHKATRRPLQVETIAWAVAAVARRIPHATCLTQALAAWMMIKRQGHEATLRIGVAKTEGGALKAHAWVESGGRIVIGQSEYETFSAFPPLGARE
jgi:hypothetical protein